MTALNIIMDEMNEYINSTGPLLPSTSKGGFLNAWHDLDNKFWVEVLEQGLQIHNKTRHHVTWWVENDINALLKHIEVYGEYHPNILNPTIEDTRKLPKKLKEIQPGLTVKKVLWRTMMNIREQLYNPFMDIDLPNDPSSRGKLNATPFEAMFSWN